MCSAAGRAASARTGSLYTLDLGTVLQNSGILSTTLFARNAVAGPADLLDGLFQFLDTPEFNEVFNPFANLAASSNSAALLLSLNTINTGTFTDSIVLHGTGHNGSGYSAAVADITLVIRATVSSVAPPTVPEPGSLVLLALGVALMVARSRRPAGTTVH